MPENVSAILYHSSTSVHFIREAVSASREVLSTAVPLIIDALIHVAYSSTSFSDLLLAELLKQYHSVSSGELKNLSSLLVDVLVSPHFVKYFLDLFFFFLEIWGFEKYIAFSEKRHL